MPDLTATQWLLAILSALGIGIAKSGFAGVSMVHVLIFAFLFGARNSTGVVLPMLIVGDICAVLAFRQHARWDYIRRMLGPACVGVIAAWAWMHRLDENLYKPVIGGVILALRRCKSPGCAGPIGSRIFHMRTGSHGVLDFLRASPRCWRMPLAPSWRSISSRSRCRSWNLSAPAQWFFFILNVFKVPFSAGLGLIHRDTLLLNAALVPAIVFGLFFGRWLIRRVSQRLFDGLLLAFAAVAALRLLRLF
jgi:uncharacterized membrane protein YfcA